MQSGGQLFFFTLTCWWLIDFFTGILSLGFMQKIMHMESQSV